MPDLLMRTWDPQVGAILRFGHKTKLSGNVHMDQRDYNTTRVVLDKEGDYVTNDGEGMRYIYRDGRVVEEEVAS
jgi:hypothetical protein